ncbi:MAG: hypothetical protein A3F72_02580 [Bacteroidetes bacterium RIFCSPLOWO2_12_FULL_35_15]|nr:MAG: hypothetical protein A3F72_02580 [Bacteroidetes bacterium RIFCSPLOWO2_12_FULL_35_15]
MKKTTTEFTSKSNRSLLCFLSICVFFTLSNCAYAQKKDAPEKKAPSDKLLAGKVFTIELTSQGGKKAAAPESDELTFKSDKFTSKLMKTDNKFIPSPYTATIDSSNTASIVINFETEMKNPDEELIKWSGKITGEDIEGTAVWTNKKGKTKKEYNFTGTIKGKKKK